MKNRREAIIEYLRLDLSEELFKEHLGHVIQQQDDTKQAKLNCDMKPVDQVDVFKWHCEMLEKFAEQQDKQARSEQEEIKKSEAKERRTAKALRMLSNKTQEMYRELN